MDKPLLEQEKEIAQIIEKKEVFEQVGPIDQIKKKQEEEQKLIQKQEIQKKKEPNDTCKIVQVKDRKNTTYYLPAFVRFKIKEIGSVDPQNIQGSVIGTLIISIYYGNIPDAIVNTIFGKDQSLGLTVEFNRQESLLLKENSEKGITKKMKAKKNMVQYTIRQSFKTGYQGKMFYSPFSTLNLYFLVVIQSLSLSIKINNLPGSPEEEFIIKCNCMDSKTILLLNNDQSLSFGINQLALNNFEVKYSTQRQYPFQDDDIVREKKTIKKKQKKKQKQKQPKQQQQKQQQQKNKLEYYQYAHFKIALFQYPSAALLKVFIPMILLGVMGLAVFFQEQSFGSRLSTIAVIALSYISLIGAINQSIPPSPKVKLFDILILLQLLATVLLLVESFQIRDQVPFDFIWYESELFIISSLLNIITLITILVLYIEHQFILVPHYIKKKKNLREAKDISFKDWGNRPCYQYFQNKKSQYNISFLQ